MHKHQIEEIMVAAEHAFFHELRIVEEFLGHRHPRHAARGNILAITEIAFSNNQKIGGFIMDFTLNKANPSVLILIQALLLGAVLPDIDTVTGHPTVKEGSLALTGDANIVISQDPTNPKLVTVARASNTFSGQSTLGFTALNDNGDTISGSSIITIESDPVVDNGIADALQAVPAPVATA